MNHLFDFPGKKANLHLALLHIFGGCAMLGLCAHSFVLEAIEFKGRDYVNLSRPPLKNSQISSRGSWKS